MNGRILSIKKTYILRATAILCVLSFIASIFMSIFLLNSPELWFYFFCLFVGIFQLVKGFLFRFDSCLYLGTLLCAIGGAGLLYTFAHIEQYAGFFIALAFVAASVVTYCFSGQKFHLIFSYSIIFVLLYTYLYIKNFITTPIFIAFLTPFLVSLLTEILFICFHKK